MPKKKRPPLCPTDAPFVLSEKYWHQELHHHGHGLANRIRKSMNVDVGVKRSPSGSTYVHVNIGRARFTVRLSNHWNGRGYNFDIIDGGDSTVDQGFHQAKLWIREQRRRNNTWQMDF